MRVVCTTLLFAVGTPSMGTLELPMATSQPRQINLSSPTSIPSTRSAASTSVPQEEIRTGKRIFRAMTKTQTRDDTSQDEPNFDDEMAAESSTLTRHLWTARLVAFGMVLSGFFCLCFGSGHELFVLLRGRCFDQFQRVQTCISTSASDPAPDAVAVEMEPQVEDDERSDSAFNKLKSRESRVSRAFDIASLQLDLDDGSTCLRKCALPPDEDDDVFDAPSISQASTRNQGACTWSKRPEI